MKKTRHKGLTKKKLGMIIISASSILLLGLITLTILFAIENSKYEEVFGTVNLDVSDPGKREVSILYVVDGEAFMESIDRAPRSWKNDQLVVVEYHQDLHYLVRVPLSSAPYVVGYIFLGATMTAGIMLVLGKSLRRPSL